MSNLDPVAEAQNSEASSDDSDDVKQPHPQPMQTKQQTKHLHLQPMADTATLESAAERRSKMFDPGQSMLWSKKSIAFEYSAMLQSLQDQKIDYDASGGSPSDLDQSDSPDDTNTPFGTNSGGIPNLDTYTNTLMDDLHGTLSISDVKFEHNKAMKEKLDKLHDKINIFIKKIHLAMRNTKEQRLIAVYQTAYDFLEDIQHAIESFDDEIAENEQRSAKLESDVTRSQQQFNNLMMKLQKARIQAKQYKERYESSQSETMELRKQMQELSIANSELQLSVHNSLRRDDDQDADDEEEMKEKKQRQKQEQASRQSVKRTPALFEDARLSYEYNPSSFDASSSPKHIHVQKMKPVAPPPPAAPSLKKKKQKVSVAPARKYRANLSIDEEKHAYLFDEFKRDNGNQCVAEFWNVFSREIGFFVCGRHG